MPVARPEPTEVRVIAHVDLDCFYVQVEQRKRPELRGKPTGVVQYNPWKGGGLIAVGYEARKFGVTRNMRGDEAKKVCPDIELIQVPVAHGKADLTQYRDAGSEVVTVLSRKGTCERASIDEVYLDITEASAALTFQEPFAEEVLKSHILGLSEVCQEQSVTVEGWLSRSVIDFKDRMLANGAIIIADLREAVLTETGFTCSAGIAHNKMIAKLASGMHKPAQQTVVPSSSVTALLAALPIKKMKQLGGKLGDSLQNDLHVSFVGDLLQFSETRLQDLYGVNTGTWLWSTARGLSGDEVKSRTLPKSHSCGKTFFGPNALKSLDDVKLWITELAMELQERLDVDLQQNHRMAHLLTLHAGTNQGYKTSEDHKFPSKSCVLRFGKEKIASDGFKLFERGLNDYLAQNKVSPKKRGGGAWAVTSLFIGASNIWTIPSGVNPITHFFSSPTSPACSEKGGPSAPLSSFGVLDLDASSSPCKSPDAVKETDCDSYNNFNTWGLTLNSEPSIFVPSESEQFKNNKRERTSLHLPIDRSKKGVDDSYGKEPSVQGFYGLSTTNAQESDVMVDDLHGKEPRSGFCDISTTDVQEIDFMCTPTFGEFRDVYQKQCSLHLPASSPSQCEISSFNIMKSSDPDQKRPEALDLIIDCSPVDQEAPVVAGSQKCNLQTTYCSPVDQEAPVVAASERCNLRTTDICCAMQHEVMDTSEHKAPLIAVAASEDATFHNQQPSGSSLAMLCKQTDTSGSDFFSVQKEPVAETRQQVSGILKLKDVWHRKLSGPSPSARPAQSQDRYNWEYKEGDIDREVFSELPEEIQEELCRSLGYKRSKKPTIGDFFKHSSSGRGKKADL